LEEPLSFLPLLLVVFLAFAVPLVISRARRLQLPVVVGEIVAGIAVGRSGLRWVPLDDPVLGLLSEFGFVFLMFLAGMEVNFSHFGLGAAPTARSSRRGWSPLLSGSVVFALTLALSAGAGFGLARLGLVRSPYMMALILSTTSLGVVMPVLKESGLIVGRFGQTVLVASTIADFATMLLITVVIAVISRGLTLDILLVGLLFVAFFLMVHFGTLFSDRVPWMRRVMEEMGQASTQIKVRAAFTVMLAFVVLARAVGTEVILGAFLAGAIVSLLRAPDDTQLVQKLEAIGFGFFIPIFFVMVGVEFNLGALLASAQAMLLVPLLLVLAIVVKLGPALVLRQSFSWRETLAAGALLSARLSLIIAASAIGLRLGVIGESVNAAIIVIALVTVILAPVAFFRLAPQSSRQPRPVVVAGAGDLGLRVADQLRAHGETVVVVDPGEARTARARQRGLDARTGDLTQARPADMPFLDEAQALVATHLDADLNYAICRAARADHGIGNVVVQVNEPGEIARFQALGVSPFNAAVDRAAMLVLLTRNPAAYSLLTQTEDDKVVLEAEVGDVPFQGQTLRQIKLPGDVLILAIRREGDLLVPHGNTQLWRGDHVTLVGSHDSIGLVRRMLLMGDSGEPA
jgi:Kef-type K+ transport system membrane component KefB/Trk K+ transport system NAD-binding subunit